MTPRENLLRLYRREGYECVPVAFNLCPSLMEEFHRRYPEAETPAEQFDFPWRCVAGASYVTTSDIDWMPYYDTEFKDGTHFDAFGIAHEPGSIEAAHMTRMHHPMKNFSLLDEFESYPYPEVDEDSWQANVTQVKELHGRGIAALASMECTIWETAWYMRSMESLMMDMLAEPELASYHLDKITEVSTERAVAFAKMGVDILCLGDDIGMQSSIMLSEAMYREWLKPRLRSLINAVREVKPDILIQYHSCGFVIPFIDDLIEVGVDVLNPVQPESMDFKEIHERFGDRVSFNGTIGTQTTMPFGSPQDVHDVVVKNLKIAGSKGGLLPCPTHLLEPEVPWENIEAYVNACRSFRL